MKAQQLKNSILQYAMQGKLVEQDPNDEPASVLLERIKVEKEQLIKDKVVKREKALAPIKDEEIPFEIPDLWEWVRIKDICLINPKNKAEDEQEAGFIPMKMINDGFSNHHSYDSKPWGSIKKGYTHFKNNDIAIAKITPCFENKKSVIFNELPNNIGAGTTELIIVRPFTASIDLKYLFYIFKTQHFINEGIKSFTGTAGQQRVAKSFMEHYIIGLPPLAEQRRISEKIERLFKKVDQYDILERQITSLNNTFPVNMEKSILQYAMQGKLVEQNPNDEPASALLQRIQEEKEQLIKDKVIKREKALPPIADEEIPFEIPDSWEWVRLGQVGKLINGDRGKNYPSKKDWINEGIPFINAGALGVKYLDESKVNYISEERFNLLRSGFIKKNDLLYCLRGSLGKVSINDSVRQGAIASSIAIVRLHENLNPYYFLYVLKSPLGNILIDKVDNGTAQPNLSAKSVSNYIIPIPPIKEQYRIVSKIEEMLKLTNRLKESVNSNQ